MEYILIVVLTFAVYFRSFEFGHTVDDDNAFKRAQQIKKQHWSLDRAVNLLYGAGLFVDKRLDRLVTIVLNCTIACMILYNWGYFWVALLWIIHPINNQLTLWLNGRRYQVSLLLGLLAYKFPIAGFILFPLAVYIHPISAPFIVITAFMVTPWALLWAFPSLLAKKKLHNWLQSRFAIQNFEIYKNFNCGKPILATKCFAEYIRHGLFPSVFTMYHPEIWGIAELEGNKQRAYALNASFWLSLTLILFISYVGWFMGGLCLVGLLIAFIGVVQWLGILVNPTQLWAQRYACVSSIGFTMFTYGVLLWVGEPYHTIGLTAIVVWYLCFTLKEMEMYRDIFSFFWMHYLQQPHNQNAALFGSSGFNQYADVARKEKKFNETAIYSSHSLASSLFWCLRNRTPDMVHQFASQQLEGLKVKKPLQNEGA